MPTEANRHIKKCNAHTLPDQLCLYQRYYHRGLSANKKEEKETMVSAVMMTVKDSTLSTLRDCKKVMEISCDDGRQLAPKSLELISIIRTKVVAIPCHDGRQLVPKELQQFPVMMGDNQHLSLSGELISIITVRDCWPIRMEPSYHQPPSNTTRANKSIQQGPTTTYVRNRCITSSYTILLVYCTLLVFREV